ncbi:hypothetical protein [Streptomyces sp. CFMR 7]|uniref:hypothetical protein n=1 Tax=Streptomyces sp. CFMR 7 TaxID=1649184 RepID=UPI0006AD1978|nr:hypothetical protein [Streptomyces sp. CFMR 7]ALC32346.1 hypothetical protein ABE83_34940 [Streptomyces sp. CFMR 7]
MRDRTGPRHARTSTVTSLAPGPGADAVPRPGVQPAGGTDAWSGSRPTIPSADAPDTLAAGRRAPAPYGRTGSRPAPPRPPFPVPRLVVRLRTPSYPVPQMRALCRRAGAGVVPPALAHLYHGTYGR